MGKKLLRKLIVRMYGSNRRFIRNSMLKMAHKIDASEFNYHTLREIFIKYWDVEIGEYSMGGCFVPYAFDRHTTIGRYCSFAGSVRGMNRNHPMEYKSTHALFYNPKMNKEIAEDPIEYIPLEIGSDVWMGHNAIIMPAVTSIGHGAVIAAGAVVNKNIPPYAVVVGNPARVIRYRFSPEKIEKLLESKWWEKPFDQLDSADMCNKFEDDIKEEVLDKENS